MNKTSERFILLDTHVWIWFVNGNAQLRPARKVSAEIETAAKESRLRLSAISVWEVSLLNRKGRVFLKLDCMDWVRQSLALTGIQIVPLTPEISVESNRLPGHFHGDPADRIIVATARHTGAILATHDQAILTYARQDYLNVIPV